MRSVEGGVIEPMPLHLWHTEGPILDLRFMTFRFNAEYPFGGMPKGFKGRPCYVFASRLSLATFLPQIEKMAGDAFKKYAPPPILCGPRKRRVTWPLKRGANKLASGPAETQPWPSRPNSPLVLRFQRLERSPLVRSGCVPLPCERLGLKTRQ
jgi:hypothetical protein